MKSLLLFLCLASFSFAGDCTALTFTTLSELVQHPVSYRAWADDLGTDKQSPSLYTAIAVWNQHFMLSPLVCVYSKLTLVPATERELLYNIPYLWVGTIPAEMQFDPNEIGVHCALVIFRIDHIDIIHNLSPDGYYFVERLSYNDFFPRTTAVYEVVPLIPIVWKELPRNLFR